MAKTVANNKILIELPIIDLDKPYKLTKPVVMLPAEKYQELLDDMADLRSALKAEEEHLIEGGKAFSEYDKQRKQSKK